VKNRKNILVLTYWPYDDALIQTYTLPYVNIISKHIPAGGKIFLQTLNKSQPRLPMPENHKIRHIPLMYREFGLRAGLAWMNDLLKLYRLIRKEKINTLHAWCTPAGMMGYLLSKLTGAELIIDSYEPHAEAMVENGEWKKTGKAYRLLFRFEKLQTHRASFLIAAAGGMQQYAREKYGHFKNNFFVKPACVELEKFRAEDLKDPFLLAELGLQDKIVGVYAGKLGGIYLEKEVFDLIKAAEDHWKGRFRFLLLSSTPAETVSILAKAAGLGEETIIHRFVPHSSIPRYMGLADFGITPVKPVPTKRFCTPIKDGEYWALGLPVIITKNISDDSDIIRDNKIGSILADLNGESYKKAVMEIDGILSSHSRKELFDKIRGVAVKYRNYDIAEKIYKTIYNEQAP
jgi:glycosyltransferase involved in cell wall biosynthesis